MKPKQKKLIIIVSVVVGIAIVAGLAVFFGKGTLYKGDLCEDLGFCDPDPLPRAPDAPAAKLGGIAGPDHLNAGITGSFSINFTTTKEIPNGGSIRVMLPAGFDASDAKFYNCELAGDFSLEKTTSDMTVHNLLRTPANSKIVCHFLDVKNPPEAGDYEGFSLRTYKTTNTGDPTALLDWFDSPSVIIAPAPAAPAPAAPALPANPIFAAPASVATGFFAKKGTTAPAPTGPTTTAIGKLKNASVTLDGAATNPQTSITVKFTPSSLPSELPIYGRIFVRFPKEFDLTNPLSVDCNINGGLLATGVPTSPTGDNTVIISRTGSTPDSTSTTTLTAEVVCHLQGIKLPQKDGSYSPFYIATNNGANITIDETTDVPPVVITGMQAIADKAAADKAAADKLAADKLAKDLAIAEKAKADKAAADKLALDNSNPGLPPTGTTKPPITNQPSLPPTPTQHAAADTTKCQVANPPNDVPDTHWAKDFIKQAYDRCIFSGYPDGGFHPNANISRAEGLKAILASAGIQGQATCNQPGCNSLFTDLVEWQKPWVFAALEYQIIGPAKLLLPERPLNRGEVILVVSRAFGFKQYAGQPDNIFDDVTNPTLAAYLHTAWDNHIIQGKFPHKFDPYGAITRAEIAKIIIKSLEVSAK